MTMLAICVHNSTRSCIMMRQFENGVWTLPMKIIPNGDDPMHHIDDLLKQVDGEFELVSAISMVDYVDQAESGDTRHSIVYDIKYRGKVHPGCPESCKDRYSKGKWMHVDTLKEQPGLSHPTLSLVAAMETDSSLR